MIIKFQPSNQELVDLYVYNNWSAPWRKNSRQRLGLALSFAMILFGLALVLDEKYVMGGIIIGLAILWFLLYDKIYTTRLSHFAKGFYNHEINEKFWTESTYNFKQEHIHVKNEYIDAKIEWKGIINVMEKEQVFWLFETFSSAHIIPKRALSDKELQEFRSLLATKFKQK